MGGSGSGRWGGKPTIGRTRSYQLSTQLLRDFIRLEYSGFRINFHCDFDEIPVEGVIDTACLEPYLGLVHLARCDPPERQIYKISLTCTYPYGGGVRWWFLCPETGRRAAKLYLPLGGRRFLSRQAYSLVHDTRQMCRTSLLSRRITCVAEKLGQPSHHFYEPPEKPTRMRWRTYDRLVERWYKARDAYWATLNRP